MQKEFTINVPDQLWVDSWTENKTQTLTYDGPEKYYVIVTDQQGLTQWSAEPLEADIEQRGNPFVVEVDATEHTDVAYWLLHHADPVEHEFIDEVNHDGSIFKKITNPSIRDIYFAQYDIDQSKIVLLLITRRTTTYSEIQAQERLAYVNRYSEVYAFSDAVEAAIATFKSDTTTYLDSMKDIYPWKYVSISTNNVPRIPSIVVTEFAKLPEPGRKM